MNETIEQVSSVRRFAESPLKDTRVVDEIEIGQWVRQGDVYLTRIAAPSEWKETKNRQLAIGTTIGSRHTVDGSVTVLANPENGRVVRSNIRGRAKCFGPQVLSPDRFTVEHPEHADISLPGGCYQVQFQVDPASMQRVQD